MSPRSSVVTEQLTARSLAAQPQSPSQHTVEALRLQFFQAEIQEAPAEAQQCEAQCATLKVSNNTQMVNVIQQGFTQDQARAFEQHREK